MHSHCFFIYIYLDSIITSNWYKHIHCIGNKRLFFFFSKELIKLKVVKFKVSMECVGDVIQR